MKKVLWIIFLFLGISSHIQAQEKLIVRRLLKFEDNVPEGKYLTSAYDSPNARFMPMEKELIKYILQWAKDGKLQAYSPWGVLDFSTKMSPKEVEEATKYYYWQCGDSIDLRPFEVGIEIEEYVTERKGKLHYQIESIVLHILQGAIEETRFGRKFVFRLKYEAFKTLCNETYNRSKKLKYWHFLECSYQPYDDNTRTISFADALDKRYFHAEIIQVIPEDKRNILAKEKNYNPEAPQKLDSLLYLPHFMRIGKKKIQTTITEEIDLRATKGFLDKKNVIEKFLRKISRLRDRSRKTNIYHFNGNVGQDFSSADKMTADELRSQMVYFDAQFGDSIELRPQDLYLIHLKTLVKIKINKNIKYKPYLITLMIPQGTNEETKLGNKMICTIKYSDFKKYFRKVQTATNGSLYKFDNIFDENIQQMIYNKNREMLKNKELFLAYCKNQRKLLIKYLEGLSKG